MPRSGPLAVVGRAAVPIVTAIRTASGIATRLGSGVARALERATDPIGRDVPFCPLLGDRRIGADWARRRGLEADAVPGEVDDLAVFDRPGFDATAVHPEVRRFYERTAEYDLAYETTWHRGFRTGARLASLLTGRLGQLALPGRSDAGSRRLESRIARVPRSADPRPGDARVWTRTDPRTGSAVFVAVYATHERGGTTYANVAAPLPRSNLSTVLRPEHLETGAEATGVRFTTRGDGDGGLFLVTPAGAVELPLEQSFRVWPAGTPGAPVAPPAGDGRDADLVASHEMWVRRRQFLTIRYAIARPPRG